MPMNTNRWNRIRYALAAPVYDRLVGFADARSRSIELLALRPGERVLLVGAGTGQDLPFLPEDVDVHAIDLTPAMVQRTRKRAEALGRPVHAAVMDAQDLDYPDASFDAVVLHLIVAVAPDPKRVLQEAARVLRPRGRAVVFDKFAREGRGPSLLRRALNLATNFIATDITRQLGPIVNGTDLWITRREPAALGGRFEIARLEKTEG